MTGRTGRQTAEMPLDYWEPMTIVEGIGVGGHGLSFRGGRTYCRDGIRESSKVYFYLGGSGIKAKMTE